MRAPFTTICTCFVFCLISTPLIANEAALLQLYQANYSASFNGIPIEAKRQLTKHEQGYRLETSAHNFIGNMQETERLHLDPEGAIRIDAYTSKRSFFGSKRKEQLIIDHQRNKAIYTRKKKKRETDLQPDYLGPISYQLQERETIFWMAKKYDYLPVKVWQREEDGESYEMLLKSLTLEGRK